MSDQSSLFINGAWLDGEGETFESLDPVRGEPVWRGRSANAENVAAACGAAREAFFGWSRASHGTRTETVQQFGSILRNRSETIARTMARETGKALWDCRQELAAAAAKIDISIRAFDERTGTSTEQENGRTRELRHKPHGVLAVFGPFNFPVHLPNGHIVPALIAGNTVVFKPSEMAPACASLYADCWRDSGLPAGVLNVLNGGRQTGAALIEDPRLDGVLFTGSAAAGSAIHQRFAGRTGKILALELGGNNPLVVADIDDIDGAAVVIVNSAFIGAGQRCTCARRLVVKNTALNRRLIRRLEQLIDGISVGDPLGEPQPFMGSVISNGAADHILQSQARLLSGGAAPIAQCRRLEPGKPLLRPGLVDVTDVAERPDEEIFGPLLQIVRVDSLDEAIDEANRTSFGLSAGILTDDDNQWRRFLVESRAGIVNRNLPLTGASSAMPFGGIGSSGNLRPSAYYAADYCAYPVSTMTAPSVSLPDQLPPGLSL